MDNVMEEDMQHTDTVLVQMPHNGLIEINVICRLCANPNERIIGIYSEEGISNNLATKMNNYLPVKVSENDSLPLQCCWSCASTVLAWHELVVASVEADRRLRELHNINEKDSSSSDIYSCMDESNSPEEPENKSEHKSAAASLNVFCQEATSPTKSVKLTKKKRITLPYNITQLGEVKREDWIQCDVITDESLQKYIETIQNPFVDTVNTTIHKIIRNETESEPLNKSKSKKNNEDEDPDDKKVFVVSPSIENSLVLTEDIKASELAEEDKHDTSEDYNFACQYCSLLFVKEDEIINHVKVEHPDKDLDFINGNSKELSKKERRKNTKLDHDIVNAAKVVVEGRIYYNCKICGKSLHSPYTYIWHMRIHTGERPYVCDLCGKQFRVSQGLVRHLRETHEGIKNFGCDLCGRMFATRRNVEEHRRIHTNERPYICDLCGKSFKQKASLFVHNRSHTDSFPFRCSYCNQGFRTRPPLLIHVTRHTGEKPYPCDVCGRCFRIKYELKRHKLIHSEEKPFSCSECGLSFRQKRYLRNHNKINHERMASYANDLSVSSAPIQATIKEEPQNEDTKLKIEKYHYCAECNITFETNKLLVKHQAKKHGIAGNSDDESSTFCEPCNLTFESHYSLLEHTKLEHPSSNDPPKRRRRVDIVYDIFCDVCSTGFTRLVDMKKHRERKHPEADPYKPLVKKEIKQIGDSIICIECGSSFTKKIEFNDHMKKQHNRVIRRFRRNRSEITAQFFCDICGKGFTRKYDMEKHRKTKHPTDTLKPEEKLSQKQRNVQLLKRCQVPGDNNTTYYKCEICSRLFKKSYNLVKHMSIHTGARDYFCHICGKNFRVSNGLYRHISEHHYGIKKHPCEICGKFFATTATRDDHRNIHTDTRPFICDICGKAFRQKASLHVHKLFHSNNFRFTCNICGKKYRRSTELKIHSWLHTGHKPHQCHLCEARFRLRQDLKRHIKIHNKLTECICHECGSVFSQEKYLNNHKKIHVVKGPLALVMAPLPPL